MNVNGISERTLREIEGTVAVSIIDQTRLPGRLEHIRVETVEAAADAIRRMKVRGAPLIGITAAYGVAMGLRADPSDEGLARTIALLRSTRPTAVNLQWALETVRASVQPLACELRATAAWRRARQMAEDDVAACEAIGVHGAELLDQLARQRGGSAVLNIMTHCNAGWLAAIDWGTALAPVYRLHDAGVRVHVYVSETRPRNQGLLTAWELAAHGVPFTLAVDNAAGLLLGTGKIDACIVGADRVTRRGDVCNKIGTVLKALAASHSGVPFYVAAPSSSIDWQMEDPGLIPIEERAGREVSRRAGVRVTNPGFDVTPAALVTALVTERGVCAANQTSLASLFPERVHTAALSPAAVS